MDIDFAFLEDLVKKRLENDPTGHDFFHVKRVLALSRLITEQELKKGNHIDINLVKLIALLHDLWDWKFNDLENLDLKKELKAFLEPFNLEESLISKLAFILENFSFKGAKVEEVGLPIEAKIVKDADRLDALGAIGIARCFATGAKLNRKIYDPSIKPILHETFESYKSGESTSINHFYEKLLLLKDKLYTETAKKIAKERHDFMEQFLERFFKEWNLEDFELN